MRDYFPIPPIPALSRAVQPLADKYNFPTLPLHIHEVLFAAGLYTVVHLWGYRDLTHRAEVRRALAGDAAWQTAVGRLMPLLQGQEATILVPTSYSPCR